MSIKRTLIADGKTSIFIIKGDFQVHTSGTYGGGTTTVEMQQPDGTFETLADTDDTVAADYIVSNEGTSSYKVDITGSTTPSVSVVITGNILTPQN